jgi:hypothetical protein
MREVVDWIDRELDRLDREGKADAAEPEQAPAALRAALGETCQDQDRLGTV